MKRLVRIDDFPHGDLAMFLRGDYMYYRQKVASGLEVFERNDIPYILAKNFVNRLLKDNEKARLFCMGLIMVGTCLGAK